MRCEVRQGTITAQVAGVVVDKAAMQSTRETEPHSIGEALDASPALAPEVRTPEALPPGSKIDEFEIVRVLGAGGFGIVYLALDQQLLRYVAIKEFIPTALARRTPEGAIVARSPDAAETFAIGLDSFYNEGRLLARFDNPSLVRVFRFWKANGTAYMAMQYYPGQTLKEARRQMAAPPDEAWLRLFVDRLLGALETLHAEGVYHRDIAPDNILLLPDGQPVILDFGSARRVISDRTQSLTAILKPNYSPVEQYADDAGMRQGGYTDLYALGGTVYFMLGGKEPIPAVMRAVRDSFPVLALSRSVPFTGVSREFLAVIDWMLGVSPDDRPQTVAETRAALRGEVTPPQPTERHGVLIGDPNQPFDPARATAKTEIVAPRPAAAVEAAAPPDQAPQRGRRRAWIAMAAAGVAACAALVWAMPGTLQPSPMPARTAVIAAEAPASAGAVVQAVVAPPAVIAAPPASAPAPALPASAPVEERRTTAAARAPIANHMPPNARPIASAEVPVPARPAPVKLPAAAASMPMIAARAAGAAAPCADMNVFARASCLSRACDTPQWKSHPQCVEARAIAEQRQRRMEQ